MTHIIIPIAAVFLTMFDTQLHNIPFASSFFNNAKMEFGLIKPCCSPPAAFKATMASGKAHQGMGTRQLLRTKVRLLAT